MKRSEMIEHITEDLLEKLDHYKLKQGKRVWAKFVANELLDMIEGFGMTPPSPTPFDSGLILGWEEEDPAYTREDDNGNKF